MTAFLQSGYNRPQCPIFFYIWIYMAIFFSTSSTRRKQHACHKNVTDHSFPTLLLYRLRLWWDLRRSLASVWRKKVPRPSPLFKMQQIWLRSSLRRRVLNSLERIRKTYGLFSSFSFSLFLFLFCTSFILWFWYFNYLMDILVFLNVMISSGVSYVLNLSFLSDEERKSTGKIVVKFWKFSYSTFIYAIWISL